MPGSMRSSTTRSTPPGDSSRIFSAAGPSPAIVTRYPSATRLYLMPVARCARLRRPGCALRRAWLHSCGTSGSAAGGAGILPVRGKFVLGGGQSGRGARQLHLEDRARPLQGIADADAAAKLPHEVAGQVQSQAGAGLLALQLQAQPLEAAENPAAEMVGDAAAIVGNADRTRRSPLGRALLDVGLLGRVLDRVVDQVAEDNVQVTCRARTRKAPGRTGPCRSARDSGGRRSGAVLQQRPEKCLPRRCRCGWHRGGPRRATG